MNTELFLRQNIIKPTLIIIILRNSINRSAEKYQPNYYNFQGFESNCIRTSIQK